MVGSRCQRCGSREGLCTDKACISETQTSLAPSDHKDFIYRCGLCEQPITDVPPHFINGFPLHPVCKIAIEHEDGSALITRDAVAPGEKPLAAGSLVPENALFRPAIINLTCPVPVLLTPDHFIDDIRTAIETFLTDMILAYKQGKMSYDWKTGELDLTDVKRLTDLFSKPRIAEINAKIKENAAYLAQEEDK